MGRVWRATDVVLHREVAIKELVPPPGLTPAERQEMRERSLREARAIARLNNINVVRVFDVLRTDADPWIVMEYVPSRSLQDTLAADGPFNAVRTAEIGLGVLNALKAAHRAGVVHRDVKPGNVLMGGDGRVVLTDFGLATVPGDPNVTRTGLVLGSPAYIAPERARDGTAGPGADLWSLGATLYAAVEGQSPFARPSAIATLAALATENVPPARNAGPLKPVLNGLLRKDPAHRIDAEEAERLLARAAGRRAKLSFPMSPTMRRPGVGRERPSLPSGPGGPPVLPGSGFATATGSAPVVPTPRPPVTPRPGDVPNRSRSGANSMGNNAQGRPTIPPASGRAGFTPGRATVGNPVPPAPPARPGENRLDPTRIDGPPVRDESVTPAARQAPPATPPGARQAPPAAPDGTRPGAVPGRATPVAPSTTPVVNTARIGFTAADVAANRRKLAAPEHEASLAAATGAFPVVAAPESADAVESSAPADVQKPAEAAEPVAVEAPATKPAEPEPAKAEPEAKDETSGAAQVTPVPAPLQEETETAPAAAEEGEAAPIPAGTVQPESDEAPDTPEAEAPVVEEPAAAPIDAAEKAPEEPVEPEPAEALAAQRPATALTPGQRPASAPDQDKTSVVDFTAIVPRSPVDEPAGATRVVNQLPPAQDFARSNRPAWTPMPVRPMGGRSNGVTIFGTTLTRRQAVIGAAIVLTFVLLVGIILVQAFGNDDEKTATPPAASKPAATGSKAGASNGSPSSATKPSATSASSAPAATVPAGWKTVSLGDYSMAVPADVQFNNRDGGKQADWDGRQLYIFRYAGDEDPASMFPLNPRPSGFQQQISLEQTTYQGRPAADWQYYRSTSNGGKQRVLVRGFRVGGTVYQIRWYTMEDDWNASQKDLAGVLAGFKVG
ncbi:Serine/threonine protein kinase [Actinoplanes regularis]|uniref:Serine/threonine protein kinase n=2 Tax=Actinoplanes regularis TaxID=52697 RepID=A0A238VBX9_9ACTN|nr:hypothetical protein Are01nite_01710 [Actinoplanes regularis]SNR31029.1 Serine/threonine protein kinase [Actinoplanes regularis]